MNHALRLTLLAVTFTAATSAATPLQAAASRGAPALAAKARAKRAFMLRTAKRRIERKVEVSGLRRRVTHAAAVIGGGAVAIGTVVSAGAAGSAVGLMTVGLASPVGGLIFGAGVGLALGVAEAPKIFDSAVDGAEQHLGRVEERRRAKAEQGRWIQIAARRDPSLARSPFRFRLKRFKAYGEMMATVVGERATVRWVEEDVALVRTASGPEIFLRTSRLDPAAAALVKPGASLQVDVVGHAGGGVMAVKPRVP